MRLGTIIISFALAAGCDKPPPDQYIYTVSFRDRADLAGATLYRADTALGPVSSSPGEVPRVRFELPAAEWLSGSTLTLRIPTPCGPGAAVPVTLEMTREREQERRQYYDPEAAVSRGGSNLIQVSATAGQTTARSANIWIDLAGTKRRIAVGQLESEVSPRNLPLQIRGIDCAVTQQVRVDGQPVGEIGASTPTVQLSRSHTSSDDTTNYFVTADRNACYRWRAIVYSTSDGGALTPASIGPQASVVRLDARPTYFLEDAPSSVTVDANDAPFAVAQELLRVPCQP